MDANSNYLEVREIARTGTVTEEEARRLMDDCGIPEIEDSDDWWRQLQQWLNDLVTESPVVMSFGMMLKLTEASYVPPGISLNPYNPPKVVLTYDVIGAQVKSKGEGTKDERNPGELLLGGLQDDSGEE